MQNLIAISGADRIAVLAADSTAMDTQLLVEALAEERQFEMIESPSSPAAIASLVKRDQPHVVVLSDTLTPSGVFDLIRDIRSQSPSTRVIVLLNTPKRESVINAFRAGAQGVFCRTEPFRLLTKCIQCVHAGQVWASSSQLQFVIEALGGATRTHLRNEVEARLSARELDVVVGLTEGLSNREIAQRLSLTEHTVKNYLCRIFEKLGVSSRVEVILYALGRGTAGEPLSPNASDPRPHLVPDTRHY